MSLALQRLARLLSNRRVAGIVLVAVVLLSALAAVFASRVEQDDDLLAFLPRGDADVRAFQDINRRFGGLDVAIAGIETADVFAGDFLARLKQVTATLNTTPGVGYALSLANVESFVFDAEHGGIRNEYLLDLARPDRARILGDDTARDLVSADGRGVVLYAFGARDGHPRELAAHVRAAIDGAFPSETRHYGGAPFINTYIFDVTQADLRRLAPWAIAVLVLITFVSFRNVAGTVLALVNTGLGILVSQGLMGLLGIRSNLVLGSMPIILVALGSAYPVHFLSRYYALEREHGVEEGVRRALTGIGPVIIATGLTTAAGLLSFIIMDIQPMRTFGVFTAVGLCAKLALTLTFVPAVLVLLRLKGRRTAPSSSRLLGALAGAVARHRVPVAVALTAVFIVAVPIALRIDTRVENADFYSPNSPPGRAERFLGERFGGSLFIQVQVGGDLTDPAVLRETALLSDQIAALPGVSGATSITDVLALINEAMTGDRVLPDTGPKVRLLYGFLEGKRAVRQLIDDERTHALIQVRVARDAERVLAAVRALAGKRGGDVVLARAGAVLARDKVALPPDFAARLATETPPLPAAGFTAALEAYLGSDEFLGDIPEGQTRQSVAAAVAAAGPGADLTPLVGAELAEDLARPAAEIWRREQAQARARAVARATGLSLSERRLTDLGHALVETPQATPTPLDVAVSGLPVVHEGLSRSVARNQVRSLVVALLVVLIITCLLYRSIATGLIAAGPAIFSIATLYAVMTLAGVRLDLGTSILASLVLGAGVDYAVHILSAWDGAEHAARTSGQGIWTNAFMVAAGFGVLTLGEARPLKHVGGLTAAAMILAALATFLIIPAFKPSRVRSP